MSVGKKILEERRREQHRYNALRPNTLPSTDEDPELEDDDGSAT